MKLVFCGTPVFAVPTLEALIGAGHGVELVLSQPDKPVGRDGAVGRRLFRRAGCGAKGMSIDQRARVVGLQADDAGEARRSAAWRPPLRTKVARRRLSAPSPAPLSSMTEILGVIRGRMWSPLNRSRDVSSAKQRWPGVWPGVNLITTVPSPKTS